MGCAVGGLLLYALGQYQANYMNAQQSQADQRKESSRAYCYEVATFGPICISDDNAAQAEAERADDDLKAQQDMAESTRWLLIFTGLQIVVGGFGLWGLWSTLRATRKGNNINRRIGEAQTRAYMSVVSGNAQIFQDETLGGYSVKISMTFANSGNSPAIRFRWGVKIAFAYLQSDGDERGLGLVTPEAEGYDIPANTPKFGLWVTHPELSLTPADIKAWRLGRLRIYVDLYTVFRDVFGREIPDVECFRADFPARVTNRHSMGLTYAKGIKSIPSYLDELQANEVAGVRRPKRRRLGGRIEQRPKDDEEEDNW